jgi:hypothetical protein
MAEVGLLVRHRQAVEVSKFRIDDIVVAMAKVPAR